MSTVRDRVRAETIDGIKACARRQLAVDGADLSLRAIARELGMVSSAIYRYFAGRDELLTALIVDGYTALADRVEAQEGAVPRDRPAERFTAVGHAVRDWARAHRAEYALLYGSPVPGYAAPAETVAPVLRMTRILVEILVDAAGLGLRPAPVEVPERLRRDIVAGLAVVDRAGVDPALFARGFTAWASLFGVVSFELFGHSVGITDDFDALFAVQLAGLVEVVGLR
ncbi:TetR/AcrR family transcriptional regulator [Nakamurella deserti]|uniref:TetR/AcrR family transcriptional regulator n=1 Tax=Nakamurella deserti TaxID=2164074 RepID=UPI000DBE01D1|nr:TetR/AcrR family transcriptional regulator [Nakamurella deserti]